MARSYDENKAIADKVKMLKAEGLPTDRATAAAFRMFRAGELAIPDSQLPPKPKTTASTKASQKKYGKALVAGLAAFRKNKNSAQRSQKKSTRAGRLSRRRRR